MKLKNHLCLFAFLPLCLGCNENVLKVKYYSWNLFVSCAAFSVSLISILELSLGV